MDQIEVHIKTQFIEEQSQPENQRFVYAYTITISNRGDRTAQLLSRHWIITDANNNTQEVQGMGVVGEQPTLAPGEKYSYTSGVILETQIGTMEGCYQMRADSGDVFDAPIPIFALAPPHAIH